MKTLTRDLLSGGLLCLQLRAESLQLRLELGAVVEIEVLRAQRHFQLLDRGLELAIEVVGVG